MDFLNKAPVGTIGVEGSQLNLLVIYRILNKLKVFQPKVAGLAFCRLAECLDADVMVRQEGGECRMTFGTVGFFMGGLAIFQEERTVQVALNKLPSDKGRAFVECLLNVRIICMVILTSTEGDRVHFVEGTPDLRCLLFEFGDQQARGMVADGLANQW